MASIRVAFVATRLSLCHFEDGKVIKCDFEPGSVERSIDRYQRGVYLSEAQAGRRYFQFPPPIKIEQIFQWV
jgi:hypothetical protein